MEEEKCKQHNAEFCVFCVFKGCQNNKLCVECIQNHSIDHTPSLKSYTNLSKITNEMINNNKKIEEIKKNSKEKDQYLWDNIPEIIKRLKETFNKFIENVEKIIQESSKNLYGDVSLLGVNTDEKNERPEKLIEKFHFFNEIAQREIFFNIEAILKNWNLNCQKAVEQISKYLGETVENFKMQPYNIKIDSKILKNEKDLITFHEILKENQTLKTEKYSLIYRATTDGDTFNDITARTQNKTPLCFLIKVKETGLIYGIFTSVKYALKIDAYYEDKDAFIFSVSKNRVFKVKYKQNACWCHSSYPIAFGGGGDVAISHKFLTNSQNYNNFGNNYYSISQNGKTSEDKTFLAGLEKYTIEEVEIFHLIG